MVQNKEHNVNCDHSYLKIVPEILGKVFVIINITREQPKLQHFNAAVTPLITVVHITSSSRH